MVMMMLLMMIGDDGDDDVFEWVAFLTFTVAAKARAVSTYMMIDDILALNGRSGLAGSGSWKSGCQLLGKTSKRPFATSVSPHLRYRQSRTQTIPPCVTTAPTQCRCFNFCLTERAATCFAVSRAACRMIGVLQLANRPFRAADQ